MNEADDKVINDLAQELSVDDIIECLEAIIRNGTSGFVELVDNEYLKEGIHMLNTIGDELSKSIATLRLLKSIVGIPNKLFVCKFEKFCKGLVEIPIEKRRQYLKKLGKENFNNESVFILTEINKVEELSKLDLFLKLLDARIDEKINNEEFHRFTIRVSNTLLSDLNYMRDNLTNGNFNLATVYQEGLYSSGWIVYSGSVWLSGDNLSADDTNVYRYSESTKLFCKLIYNKIATDETSDKIMAKVIVDDVQPE